jgi:Coenzyme PQQ synthesis protein D (PqqD)
MEKRNDQIFQINSPAVVSEIMDGEAVIMNLKSGHYYSTEGVGSLLWHEIEQGQTHPRLLELVKTASPTVPEDLAAAIDPFIDELIIHELTREYAGGERRCGIRPRGPTSSQRAREFRASVLNV